VVDGRALWSERVFNPFLLHSFKKMIITQQEIKIDPTNPYCTITDQWPTDQKGIYEEKELLDLML